MLGATLKQGTIRLSIEETQTPLGTTTLVISYLAASLWGSALLQDRIGRADEVIEARQSWRFKLSHIRAILTSSLAHKW